MWIRDGFESDALRATVAQRAARRVGREVVIEGQRWQIVSAYWLVRGSDGDRVALRWPDYFKTPSNLRYFDDLLDGVPETAEEEVMKWSEFLLRPGAVREPGRRTLLKWYEWKKRQCELASERAAVEREAAERVAALNKNLPPELARVAGRQREISASMPACQRTGTWYSIEEILESSSSAALAGAYAGSQRSRAASQSSPTESSVPGTSPSTVTVP